MKFTKTIGFLDPLKAYMKAEFPNGLFAVLDFYETDSRNVFMQLCKAFMGDEPDETGYPPLGLTVWEISQEFHDSLMKDFNKSGQDIWIFQDGELINETR